jgi:hypothetical protein
MNPMTPSFNTVSPRNTAIPLDRALEIFDALADRPDITFGVSGDGCYARAHIMCRTMQEMGLIPKKAWSFEGEQKLYVLNPDDSLMAAWWMHMAAALPVTMPDGTVEDMVFDPSLFDGPVSLKDWGDLLHAPADSLEILPFGTEPKGQEGDYIPAYRGFPATFTDLETDAKAAKTMKDYLQYQDAEPRLVFPSLSRRLISQQQPIPLQGATWIAAEIKTAAPAVATTLDR